MQRANGGSSIRSLCFAQKLSVVNDGDDYLTIVVRVEDLLDARTMTMIRTSRTTAAITIKSTVFVSPVTGTSVVVEVELDECWTTAPPPPPLGAAVPPVCAKMGSAPVIKSRKMLRINQKLRFRLYWVSIVV